MAAFERDALAGKLPVTLITGFLGSGKTTLIARLLRHPGMNRVAVVINEVGEIGIDHDLVTMSSENVSLLANGCLCCTVRTDLQDTHGITSLPGARDVALRPIRVGPELMTYVDQAKRARFLKLWQRKLVSQ